jgi:hypothetical protein
MQDESAIMFVVGLCTGSKLVRTCCRAPRVNGSDARASMYTRTRMLVYV